MLLRQTGEVGVKGVGPLLTGEKVEAGTRGESEPNTLIYISVATTAVFVSPEHAE